MKQAITGISRVVDKKQQGLICIESSIRAALKDSNIEINAANRKNIGIFLGTTFSNFYIRKNAFEKLETIGVRAVNPADFPKQLISYLGGYFSIQFGTKGAMGVFSSGLSSGLDALQQALFFLQRDKKNIAVVVDFEENQKADYPWAVNAGICFICENIGLKSRKKTYANVVRIESFFEKKNKTIGLCESIKKALEFCSTRSLAPQQFFSSHPSGSRRYVLEKKALQSVYKDNKIKFFPAKNISNASLRVIHDTLKNKIFLRVFKENLPVSLYLNIGEDANSVCVVTQ